MCTTPVLASNATTDRCCFNSQPWAELVCGKQKSSNISKDGTIYCDLNATLAQPAWSDAPNGTCTGALGCIIAKPSSSDNVKSGANSRIDIGQMWSGWLLVILILGVVNKRLR